MKNSKKLRSCVLAWSLSSLFACAKNPQDFNPAKNLKNVMVTDIVHSKILKAVGVDLPSVPSKSYDPRLSKFLDAFLEEARTHQRQVDAKALDNLRVIKYVDRLSQNPGKGVLASCQNYYLKKQTLGGSKNESWKEIEVLEKESQVFTDGEEIRLRLILYHEFFHCLYNRGHLPKFVNDEPIYGIMSEVLFQNDERVFSDWPGMVDDLFGSQFELAPVMKN